MPTGESVQGHNQREKQTKINVRGAKWRKKIRWKKAKRKGDDGQIRSNDG